MTMEFSVEDGVRLVRSLTDKVMSVMSSKIVHPDTDRCTHGVLDEESVPEIHINNTHKLTKYKRPDFLENCNEITDSVNKLVNHKSVLSAANLLPIHDVGVLVAGQTSKVNDSITKSCSDDGKHIGCNPEAVQTTQTEQTSGYMKSNLISDHCVYTKTFAEPLAEGKQIISLQTQLESNKECPYVDPEVGQSSSCDHYDVANRPQSKKEVGICDVLKEFENDITFLQGCRNKTSTPTKDSTSGTTSEHPIPNISPNKDTFKVPGDTDRALNTHTLDARKSPKSPRKTSFSPYRKHIHTRRSLTQLSTLFRKPPSLTTNDDLCLLDTDVDFPHRTHNNQLESKPLVSRTYSVNGASTGTESISSELPNGKPGTRRSLFSDSASWARFLPSLRSDKPLGYDAYQQFMNVTKTDVLPKYFFENEDEEAVYYLKVKYLDDTK